MEEQQKLIQRSHSMLIVGYFLARYGVRLSGRLTKPPSCLNVNTWKNAYDIFYDSLGDGRTPSRFRNSLKNTRDTFDVLFDNGRIGWIGKDSKQPSLSSKFESVHQRWNGRSEEELEYFVFGILSQSDSFDVKQVFSHEARTEGGEVVSISTRRERDPSLRRVALDIHGHDCMACGFNFENMYGEIGREFIEVHHVMPLADAGKRKTNPETDLVVLCSNCHRMVHRKKGICLSLNELKRYIGYS